MAFTILTQDTRYQDILAVGVASASSQQSKIVGGSWEGMDSYAIVRMTSVNGKLRQADDMLLFSGNDLWDSILKYSDIRKNTLVVCNHSLLAVGASDFTLCLEQKRIRISESKIDPDDYGLTDQDNICSKQFIVSCPPTIIGLVECETGRRITLVDIANYGIRYLVDIYNDLSDEEKELIPNYAELGISSDNAETCCALVARYMQEYHKLVTTEKMGGLALTYSSQGMRFFRRRHYNSSILTHDNDKARVLEGKCYTGGRCEYRYKGWYHGKVYLLDIRSTYPATGKNKEFPVELLDYAERPTKETVENWLGKGIVFAWVHLDTPEQAFPLRKNNKTFFPIGRFSTFLCGEEFTEAWKNGYITTVYRMAVYRTEKILSSYSRAMLDIRTKLKICNNRLGERIQKYITNGIWGQFGKINNTWIIDNNEIPDRQYGGYIKYSEKDNCEHQYRIIDWEVSRLTHGIWADNTFPAISATMNSYCRHQLYRHALLAGLTNVLYFSIDGMIVTQEGYDRLQWLISEDNTLYGSYKVTESSDSCYIQDIGVYKIGNKIAYQGIPNQEVKTYKGFWSNVSDKLLSPSGEQCIGQQIYRLQHTLPDRQRLGENDKLPGRFMAQEMLDESPLLPSVADHRYIQHGFHHGEWQ